MADTPQPRPVLVAVAGDGSESAVRFGVAEAVRRRSSLHLVHVIDLLPWREPAVLGAGVQHAREGEQVLWDAVVYARNLAEDQVAVSSELFHGEVVTGLVEVGHEASLLILQRRAVHTGFEKLPAVCLKVASRSRVPVVCVPYDWHGAEGAKTVTVGVDHATTCEPALRDALAAASSRGAALRIVCGWWMARDSDHASTTSGIDPRSVRSDLGRLVHEIVEGDELLESVPVSIDVVHARPADLLVDASHGSDLLVVGRHDPLVPHGSRIGPVARAVVTRTSCPVLLPVSSAAAHPRPTPTSRQAQDQRTGAHA